MTCLETRTRQTVRCLLCLVFVGPGLAAPRNAEGRVSPASGSGGDSIVDGRAVLQRMHARYATTWYETLAQIQSVTYFDTAGGVDHAELWYQSLSLPGRVRSDLAPLDLGRGELFRADTLFRFDADTVTEQRPGVHVVLLLAHDVYRQSVDTTAVQLEQYGFDLAHVRDSVWDGRRVLVVGAHGGAEFWVDRERLVVLRVAIPDRRDGTVRDIRFAGYEPLRRGWIATELSFLTGGRLRIRERRVWWDAGLDFEPRVFATTGRVRPGWVRN